MKITVKVFNEQGDEIAHELPAKHEVCDYCEGHGTHLREAIREHAYTLEEFRESFDDEEAEEYFSRGGCYDETCRVCNGNRVVPTVDEQSLSDDQKAVYATYLEQQEEAAQDRAYSAAERRAECGYSW